MASLASLLAISGAQADEWITNGSGLWNDGVNWDTVPLFPNAVDAVADFSLLDITGTTDVTVEVPIILGTLTMGDTSGGSSYKFQPGAGGAFTFDVTAGNAAITQAAASRDNYIYTPISLNDPLDLTNNDTGNGLYFYSSIDNNGNPINRAGAGDIIFPASSSLSGAGDFVCNGGGYTDFYQLNDNNAITGDTILNDGGRILGDDNNDMGDGNFTINEGIYVGRYNSTFSRDLGTGAGEFQITGAKSGFSANNNGFTVRLNNDDNSVVKWGDPEFDPTILVLQDVGTGATITSSKLTFKNKLDLNGAPRTIEVGKPGTGYAQITNVISNSDGSNASGLTKSGDGMLILTNTGNSYDGPTVVTGGVLACGTGYNNADSIPGGIGAAAGSPGDSNLELNGGNFRIAYYFRRTLGSGDGQFQITGGTSGFSHIQSDTLGRLYINNDVNYEVVWGEPFFQPDVLVLNEQNAQPNQVVQFQNKLDLNGEDRTVATNSIKPCDAGQVKDAQGNMVTTGGRITGVIRDSVGGAGLIKTGPGHLQLTAANTYDGGTTINEGNLEFTKITAMPATGVVTVNNGTTLTVALGGGGEWTTGVSGNGTLGGLLAGLGGRVPSTVVYVGTTSLGLNVTGAQSYSGVLSGAGNLSIGGSGSLDLTGDNTFTGDIIVDGGATLTLSGDNSGATGSIRIINGFLMADAANLPTGGVTYDSPGNNPAVLATSGVFAPTIGSSDDVYWNNNGGFAATSSALTVTPNAGATIDWSSNTAGFNGKKLHLGSTSSTASVELTNDITLDGDRTVRVFNNTGSSDDVSILSGDILADSNRNLYVEGAGTLVLSGANNFGSGKRLNINGATVRAVDGAGLPSLASLWFQNGVFESNGTFTRDFGNGNSLVYWNGGGGFSAHGGTLDVNLQAGATINWSGNPLGFRNQELRFGSETSDNVVTLQNNIDLNGDRNVRVYDNPNTTADYTVFAGIIADGSGARKLRKYSPGTLLLNGVNTYTGATEVHEGTLGGSGTIAGVLDVKGNGSLAPGASVGTLTVAGNLEIEDLANGAGTLDYELNTIAASDKITVGGALLINTDKLGLSDFAFTDLGGLENGTYVLISGATSLIGTLNAADLNGTLGLATIDLQITGNDIELVVSGLVGGSPFDTWATGGETFEGDANGDGVQDGMAFLFGAATPSTDANSLLPVVTENGSGGLVMTFSMLDAATRGAAALSTEHSGDLGITDAWTADLVPDSSGVVGDVTFVVSGAGTLNVVATIPAAGNAIDGKLFGRVRGTE